MTTATNTGYLSAAALAERVHNAANSRLNAGGSTWIQPSTHGHLHELGPVAVRDKLRNAQEQLTYWRGAKGRALHQRERDAAGARILLWEAEVEAIRRRINQLALEADCDERETATA